MLNSCSGLKGIGRNVRWCASHPPEAATALPAPRLESTWVFAVANDGPRRQASGFRWWVRKSSLYQECSSPAELSCTLLPTQGYSIYHLYNVTVGDITWAQHKQNPIISDAEKTVNDASPTKKKSNCFRTATISDTWGQSFYPEMEALQRPGTWCLRAEPWAHLVVPFSSCCNKLWSMFPGMKENEEGHSSKKPGGCRNTRHTTGCSWVKHALPLLSMWFWIDFNKTSHMWGNSLFVSMLLLMRQ